MNTLRPAAVTPDKEARASFRLAGSMAWEQYQATALHVTHDEADAWMAHLQSGEFAPVPEGHS